MKDEFTIEMMRKAHTCIMVLPRNKIDFIQRKACLYNYLAGEGRRLDRSDLSFHYVNGKHR